MSIRSSNLSCRNRRGLTLMELVVVLTILTALAAIMVPLFPNLLRRAHKATDATQTSEVAKAVQLYHALNLGYPDEFDLMTVSSGTTPPDFLPADGGKPFGGGAQIGNLTADEVAALGRVGIKSGHHFAATITTAGPGTHPTTDPYSAVVTLPTPLSTSSPVFIIDVNTTGGYPVEIRNILARDTTARFAVFGVGTRSRMVGTVIQNAPISVPQNKEFTPSTLYSRVGVIFQISGAGITTGTSKTDRARFLAAAALEDDEIESTEKDTAGYYEITKSAQ